MPKGNPSPSSGSQKQPSRSASRSNVSGSGSKIDNVLYDVITVLHEKSKGLEAYDRYEQDFQGNEEIREIFAEIRRNDEQAVQRLRECLRDVVSAGGESIESEEEEAA